MKIEIDVETGEKVVTLKKSEANALRLSEKLCHQLSERLEDTDAGEAGDLLDGILGNYVKDGEPEPEKVEATEAN